MFPINAPDICINHPKINAICRYEGEYVVRDVLQRMLEGKPWDDVNGLWTKEKKNNYTRTTTRTSINKHKRSQQKHKLY